MTPRWLTYLISALTIGWGIHELLAASTDFRECDRRAAMKEIDKFSEAANRVLMQSPELRLLADRLHAAGFDVSVIIKFDKTTPTVDQLETLYQLADTREDRP